MRRASGLLWVAGGAALWGTDTVLRQPLTGVFTPTQLVFYEHVILACIALPILIRDRRFLGKLSTTQWVASAGTALVGSALATVLFTYAIRSGSPTTAVLLQKTQPIFAIVLARLVLRESWPARFPATVAIALAGSYLVAFGGGTLLAPFSSLDGGPALLALGAAAGWGMSTIWGRMVSKAIPFELVTALRLLIALPALGVVLLLQQDFQLPSPSHLPSLLWLALVPGFAALMLYYHGLQSTPASRATVAELAFPATAFLLNWLVLGFGATLLQAAGFIVVWATIFYLSRFRT